MKKRIMIPAAIAAVMGVGAYFGHATATPAGESDLLLANAEALADRSNEGGGSSNSWPCWSQSAKSSGGYWKCGAPCEWVDGEKGTDGLSRCYK